LRTSLRFAAVLAALAALAVPGSAAADPLFGTTITYDGPTVIAQGHPVKLTVTLSQDGFSALAGKPVDISLGGQSCTGTTDEDGYATCVIESVSAELGPQTITASFAGDDFYGPSSDSSTTATVFAFGGKFVLGDVTADAATKTGDTVNFWGPSWQKTNQLSGGLSQPSFKGYADLVAPVTTCDGGLWTTRPGNSSKPPAAVPSYMAVIVSGKVTKSGPSISGDTKSIVVVKTDAGYGAAPGHRGYGGQIVAEYCNGGVL